MPTSRVHVCDHSRGGNTALGGRKSTGEPNSIFFFSRRGPHCTSTTLHPDHHRYDLAYQFPFSMIRAIGLPFAFSLRSSPHYLKQFHHYYRLLRGASLRALGAFWYVPFSVLSTIPHRYRGHFPSRQGRINGGTGRDEFFLPPPFGLSITLLSRRDLIG